MQKNNKMKISFGIIVLNGEPFTRYCLRQLYPFAYEIIVVEGASINAKEIATKDGHSIDGTLKILKEFKKNEDPENKLKIITEKGFWSEKDEQSQAYAKVATGDYLWQVDIDEFYKDEDMKKIIRLLCDDPGITAISFKQISFWGDIKYYTDGWFLKHNFPLVHRIFKFQKGYQYLTHRPPTVIDETGKNLREIRYLDGNFLYKRHGILMYHYCLLFPKQVIEKCRYYEQVLREGSVNWAKNSFFKLNNPFRVHNVFQYPSWLVRYRGEHPKQIYQMIEDIQNGEIDIEIRGNQDVEKLLYSKVYRCKSCLLNMSYYIYAFYKLPLQSARRFLVLLKRKIINGKMQ